MSREIQVRSVAGALAGAGIILLAATRPLPSVALLACFALLLGVVLLAVTWPSYDKLAVEAALFTPTADSPDPDAAEPVSPDTLQQRWIRAAEHHDDVLRSYGAYELDPGMLLRYPAMWDLSAPEVMDFHDALDRAGALRTEQFADSAIGRDYIDSVSTLRRTWHRVDRFARSTGIGQLSDGDARDCRRGLKLLEHANGSTGPERATYLRQVLDTVDRLTERGVVAGAPKVQVALQSQVRRALSQ